MAYWPANRYEVKVKNETTGSGGFSEAIGDIDVAWDTADRLRCTKADVSGLTQATVEDGAVLLRAHDERPPLATVQSESRFALSTYLTGFGAGAAPMLRKLFVQALGGRSSGTSTTVTGSGSTTTVIDVTSAAGIVVGDLVLIGGEVRSVTAVDTGATPDNITLHMALSGAPAAGTAVTLGDTYYLDTAKIGDLSDGSWQSVAMLFRGLGGSAQDIYQMRGCKGGFKVSLPVGQMATVDWDLAVNAWGLINDPGASASDATDDGPIVVKGGYVFYNTASTVRQTGHVAELGFDPGLEYVGQPSPAGSEGVAGWICLGSKARMTLRPYYSSVCTRWWRARPSSTAPRPSSPTSAIIRSPATTSGRPRSRPARATTCCCRWDRLPRRRWRSSRPPRCRRRRPGAAKPPGSRPPRCRCCCGNRA